MAGIPPVNPGEPIKAAFVNDLSARINTALGLNPDGTTMEGGKGGRAPTSAAPFREIAVFEITEEFATAQTDEEDDDKESCVAKLLQLIVSSNTYVASETERTERLYRVSAGADLIPGDHCHAWFNQQSGRWEIIAGGPGGSSSSSDVCRSAIGNLPFWAIAGYQANSWQFLTHSSDGCLYWVSPGQCPTGGGSSSSESEGSSSSGDSSSSSSEETYDCEFCEPGDDLSAVTLQIISESFWNYVNDRRYGTEGTLDIPYTSQCGFGTSVPLLSGDGFQQFVVEKVGPSLWRMYLNHNVDGNVAVWEKTDSGCCPGGTYARVSSNTVPDSEPWDFIFLYASGGPC